MTTTGTTPGATPFITGTTFTEGEASAEELTASAADLTATGAEIVPATTKGTDLPAGTPASAVELTASAAELVFAPTKGTGRQMGAPAGAAEITTAPAQRPRLSTETPRLLEATQSPAVRAASAPAPSATTTMADRKGAFRHAEAPASAEEEGRVAGEDLAAAVADIDNQSFVRFLVLCKIYNWRE